MNQNISRRKFIRKVGVSAAAVTLTGCLNQTPRYPTQSGPTPNIVFILVDDLGWRDVGFMGSTFYQTPHIDNLARQGMVFTHAYANAPNCAPTRACLLSGQYPPRHGIYTVNSSERGKAHQRKIIPTPNKTVLDAKVVTIAEALKPAGYVSASIGKWHLGEGDQSGPVSQGFDLNIAGNQLGHPKSYFSPYNNPEIDNGPEGEYLTDRLTDEALSFIEDNRDKPFFLYLPHYAVHTPLQAKKELIEKYKQKKPNDDQNNAAYAAMIESADQGVGRIMAKLEQLNIVDNTIVVFYSDNGGHVGATSNAPLRGFKGMLYEGGIRVPLIIRWPKTIQPNTTCPTPVISIDFYPTFLQITGITKPKNQELDGLSLIPLLTGRNNFPQRELHWHFPAYLEGGPKIPGPWRTTPAAAIRKDDWKLIEFFEDNHLELYNLIDDIGEKNNLADSRPDKVTELYQLMQQWRKVTNAPVPSEKNPEYDPTIKNEKY